MSTIEKQDKKGAEVFIGLVGPIGTDFSVVCQALEQELQEIDYTVSNIRISSLIHQFPSYAHLKNIRHEDERYRQYMKAGTELRKSSGRGDFLSFVALTEVRNARKTFHGGIAETEQRPIPRHAFIFNSMKNPDEVKFLREVYGSHFYLLAIHTPRLERLDKLSNKITSSHYESDSSKYSHLAEELINIDEIEDGEKLGQNVRGVYPEADFFVYAR